MFVVFLAFLSISYKKEWHHLAQKLIGNGLFMLSIMLLVLSLHGMMSWWVPLSYLCWATSTWIVASCYVANICTALSFTMSIRLLLPCLPALKAVRLLTTIEQSMVMASSCTYCPLQPMSNMVLNSPMSNMVLNSMAMKVMMMPRRIPMSDMSDDKLFEVFTDGKYELFSNGFGHK